MTSSTTITARRGRKATIMSEQSPERAALNEEPEVEGHKKGLVPEDKVDVLETEAEVEGHIKVNEDPLKKG